jgi:dTMP kinase
VNLPAGRDGTSDRTEGTWFRPINRRFGRLWHAMLLSSLGDWVGIVALAALVARLGGRTNGALAVAAVMLTRLVAVVVFGPFAGVIVDRFDRRLVMVTADVGRACLFLALPLLEPVWAIAAVAFFVEALSLLWSPARDAVVPNLVARDALARANSIILATTYGILPVGALCFTLLTALAVSTGGWVSSHPEAPSLWFDALTFLASAAIVWSLPLGKPARVVLAGVRGAFTDIGEGMRFLRTERPVGTLVLTVTIAFVGAGAVTSVGPLFARYSLNSGDTGFGVLVFAFGIGLIASSTVVLRSPARLNLSRTFVAGLAVTSLGLLALAATPNIMWATAVSAVLGAAGGFAWVSGYTLLQRAVPDDLRGRTLALLTTGSRAVLLSSRVIFPALAAAVGTATIVVASQTLDVSGIRASLAIGGLVVASAALLSRRVRSLDAESP